MEEPVYKLCKRGHIRSPDNVHKSGECKECIREYQQSEKYRESLMKHRKSEKYRESLMKYRKSDKFKECQRKYQESDRKKETLSYNAELLFPGVPIAEIPAEYLEWVEIKKLQLMLKREIKNAGTNQS